METKSFDIEKIGHGLSSIVNVFVKFTAPALSRKNKRVIKEVAEKNNCSEDAGNWMSHIFKRQGTIFGKLASANVKFRAAILADEDNKNMNLPVNPMTGAIEVPATQLAKKLEIRDKYIGPEGEFTILKERLRAIFDELKEKSEARLGDLAKDYDWNSFTESRFVDKYKLDMYWIECEYSMRSSRDKALAQEVADIATANQYDSMVRMAKGSIGNLLSSMTDELQKSLDQVREGDRVGQLAFDRFGRAYSALNSKAKTFFNKGDIEELDSLLDQFNGIGKLKRSDIDSKEDRRKTANRIEDVLDAHSNLMDELGI